MSDYFVLLLAAPFLHVTFERETCISLMYFIGESEWVGERAIFPVGMQLGICGMLRLRPCVDY